jgi:hypothetical protein
LERAGLRNQRLSYLGVWTNMVFWECEIVRLLLVSINASQRVLSFFLAWTTTLWWLFTGFNSKPLCACASIEVHDFEQLATLTRVKGTIDVSGAGPTSGYTSEFVILSMIHMFNIMFIVFTITCRPHKHIYDIINLLLIL